jgi:hypothetical protein
VVEGELVYTAQQLSCVEGIAYGSEFFVSQHIGGRTGREEAKRPGKPFFDHLSPFPTIYSGERGLRFARKIRLHTILRVCSANRKW